MFLCGGTLFLEKFARYHSSELHRLKGDLLRLGGAPPAAVEEQLQRSLEIARQQAARSFELRSAMTLARLRADQGSREEARRLLAAVHDGFTEASTRPTSSPSASCSPSSPDGKYRGTQPRLRPSIRVAVAGSFRSLRHVG